MSFRWFTVRLQGFIAIDLVGGTNVELLMMQQVSMKTFVHQEETMMVLPAVPSFISKHDSNFCS